MNDKTTDVIEPPEEKLKEISLTDIPVFEVDEKTTIEDDDLDEDMFDDFDFED